MVKENYNRFVKVQDPAQIKQVQLKMEAEHGFKYDVEDAINFLDPNTNPYDDDSSDSQE
jgi:hypothetical protein